MILTTDCPLCHKKGNIYDDQFQAKSTCKNLNCPIITFNHLWSPTK